MSAKNPIIESRELPPLENLVFEGGGIKGLVYVGALRSLQQQGVLKGIQRVGGSSAGGITAMLVGLGYTIDEISKAMAELDFRDFQDSEGKAFWKNVPEKLGKQFVKKVEEIMTVLRSKKHGLYKGDVFLQWAKSKIAERLGNPDATFRDLREAMKYDPTLKDMMFTASNISGNGAALQYFNADTTPDIKIADAVRATMSYPGAFEAHEIVMGEENGKPIKSIFVDGGFVNNCPVEYYDDERFLPPGEHLNAIGMNVRTVGLRVDNEEEINKFKWVVREESKREVESVTGMIKALVNTVTSDRGKLYARGFNMVQIPDCDINTLKFDLEQTEKDNLIQSGIDATSNYFSLYRGKGSALEVKVYQDLNDSYRNKSQEELKKKKKEILEKINALTSSDEPLEHREDLQKKIHQNILELDIIERYLRPAQSKEQDSVDIVEKLLKDQMKFALYSQQKLNEVLKDFDNNKKNIKAMGEQYAKNLATLEVSIKRSFARKLLDEAFSDMTKLHGELQARKVAIINKKEKNAPQEEIARLEYDYIGYWLKERRNIIDRFKKNLEGQSDKGWFEKEKENSTVLLACVSTELDSLYKKVTPLSSPRSFSEFLDFARSEKKRTDETLHNMEEAYKKCKAQLDTNQEKLKKLEFARRAVGSNLGEMLNLSNKLGKFIESQRSLWVTLGRWVRKVGRFFGYYPYKLVKTIAKSMADKGWYDKQTYEKRFVKFENEYFSEEDIYKEQAKALRKDIKKILDAWKQDDPRMSVDKYLELLEEVKIRSEQLPQGKIQEEFKSYITPELNRARLEQKNYKEYVQKNKEKGKDEKHRIEIDRQAEKTVASGLRGALGEHKESLDIEREKGPGQALKQDKAQEERQEKFSTPGLDRVKQDHKKSLEKERENEKERVYKESLEKEREKTDKRKGSKIDFSLKKDS